MVETCQLLEYEVNERDSMAQIQQMVAKDSKILIEDQRALLPRGQPPDTNMPTTQCWAPPVSI